MNGIERWKCAECGIVFAEPHYNEWRENHGPGRFEPWVEMICPFCGSAEVDRYYGEEYDAEPDQMQ